MYDVLIVGAGPGGIFTAYELLEKKPDLKIAVFEMGNELQKRHGGQETIFLDINRHPSYNFNTV